MSPKAQQASTSQEAQQASTSPDAQQPSTSPEVQQPTTSPEAQRASTSPAAQQSSTSSEAQQSSTSSEAQQPSTSPETEQPTVSQDAQQTVTSQDVQGSSTSSDVQEPSTSQDCRPSTSRDAQQSATSQNVPIPVTSQGGHQLSTAQIKSQSTTSDQLHAESPNSEVSSSLDRKQLTTSDDQRLHSMTSDAAEEKLQTTSGEEDRSTGGDDQPVISSTDGDQQTPTSQKATEHKQPDAVVDTEPATSEKHSSDTTMTSQTVSADAAVTSVVVTETVVDDNVASNVDVHESVPPPSVGSVGVDSAQAGVVTGGSDPPSDAVCSTTSTVEPPQNVPEIVTTTSEQVRHCRRPASTPSTECQAPLQPPPAKRPRSCTPTAGATCVVKPEDIAGWGMYAMPPNRSVFDIQTLTSSSSQHAGDVPHVINHVETQPGVVTVPTADNESTVQAETKPDVVSGAFVNKALASTEWCSNAPLQDSTELPSTVSAENSALKLEPEQADLLQAACLQPEISPSLPSSLAAVTSPTPERARPEPVDSASIPESYRTSSRVFAQTTVGGVAIVLPHGSVLFEVTKREINASTVIGQRSADDPCISLEFHQQKGLNLPKHGHDEYLQLDEIRRLKREQRAASTSSAPADKTDHDVKTAGELSDGLVDAVPTYTEAWDTQIVRVNTHTRNADVTYSWLKPQTAVSGPYQRWV